MIKVEHKAWSTFDIGCLALMVRLVRMHGVNKHKAWSIPEY